MTETVKPKDDIPIPAEAVEAAARLIADSGIWAGLWGAMREVERNRFRATATAALRAGLGAWEGARVVDPWDDRSLDLKWTNCLILPLKEPNDAV